MAAVLEPLSDLERAAATLAQVDLADLSGEALAEGLTRLEAVEGRLCAARARLVAAIDADGTWAAGGARSFPAWIRERTGRFDREASRMTREARALRDHLPGTAKALAAGEIGPDHVASIVRLGTASPECIRVLADPDVGEGFLIRQARVLDAGRFHTVMKNWALRADPAAGDRRWRDESEREELSLAKTLDGYHGKVWLSEVNGALVLAALQARAGRRGKDDQRTPNQRRAAALVELAGTMLDSGKLQPGARIRPHIAITATIGTLTAIVRAQRPGAPCRRPAGLGAFGTIDAGPAAADVGGAPADAGGRVGRAAAGGGSGEGEAGGGMWGELLGTIETALDHAQLGGAEPATLEDGTPVPFGLFAQLACNSALHRVVFGADSEILDVGREERLFTTGQTRGIIARDGQCRFPGCTAPPGQGEIHHSLWWYAQHGKTDTANGILLCRYHHGFVHQRELSIERYPDQWRFVRPNGHTFGTTPLHTRNEPMLQ
ncbi:HNH endonuclease signature motif containing protein [Georgenia faecalis]|uniref:HNH endonuclease signature motif containing protein n=1 Tax=Georgenia faecalis TaxID=2483799 RepID=UPI000FD8A8A8|nr:HNH endonuclease signature motif containing protein [Georgenia faecalis]